MRPESNLRMLEELARILGEADPAKLEAFAAFLRKTEEKGKDLALDLWAVNDELMNAGIDPSRFESMGAAVRAAIGNRGAEEDRLYKTARVLLDYYYHAGPDEFRSRFGSLDILEPCKQIIKEGEGNPHPWGEDEE